MSSPRRAGARAVAWGLTYTGASIGLQIVQGVLLIPLYLLYLDDRIYGAWIATGNVLALLTLFDPGVAEITKVRVARALGGGRPRDAGAAAGTGLVALVVVSALMALFGVVLADYVPALFNLDDVEAAALVPALRIAVVGTAIQVFGLGASGLLEALERQLSNGVGNFLATAAGLTASVVLLLTTDAGVSALAAAILVRAVLSVLFLLPAALRALKTEGVGRLSLNRVELQALRTIGVATFLTRLMGALAFRCDALLAGMFLGPTEALRLALMSRARDLLMAFPNRLVHAAMPGIARRSVSAPERTAHLSRWLVTLTVSFGATLLGGYVALNGAFLRLWLGAEYDAGQRLTFLLGFAALATVTKDAFGYLLAAQDGLRELARIGLWEATVRTLAGAALLPLIGLAALPVATLLVTGILALVTANALGRKLPGERLGWRVLMPRAVGVGALVLVGATLCSQLSVEFVTSVPLFLGAGLVISGLVAVMMAALDPELRDGLAYTVRRLTGRVVPAEAGVEP